MKMSLVLSEEQISSCRRGSDIDIEAIFGGHISGKRNPDVRVNPIFNGKHNKGDGYQSSEVDSENNIINGQKDQSSTEILVNQNTEDQLTIHQSTDRKSMVTNQESQISVRSERESLKVTNGNVLVGDIVIENGYKNPSFEGDVITESVKQRIADWSTSDRNGESNNTMQYSDSKTTDSPHTISQNNNSISDWPDLDEITFTETSEVKDPDKNMCNHGKSDPSCLSMETDLSNGFVNHNTCQSDNEDIVVKSDDGVHTNSTENGIISLENGHHDPVMTEKDDSKEWEHVNGSEIKPGKKIKERKNSVPDHIQNCVGLDRPKGIKPILVSGISVDETNPSCEQSEHKTVKFSDDTVFNDGRPNKYRRDTKLINLREIYKGKVNSDYALAKPNPIFLDDNGLENSLTDDEKVARSWGQVKGYMALPTFLSHHMITSSKQAFITDQSPKPLQLDETGDIETIETEGKPRYDRLIKQTIARQRRSKLIRLIFAFLAFLVVIAAVVLLVIYFGKS
ncbi:uncharacterized protein LOC132548961 [Ylistrum balloti]|uniref:uncharacterized protein LOC132548961 n=1 Tax=Ylistrum balloti TaxID=509963 RepID=UPI002905AE9A|nr:uncharacterized protein LOC132548961 [Ylistrum balloti]